MTAPPPGPTDLQRRTAARVALLIVAAVALVVTTVVIVAAGLVGNPESGGVPCDQLPSVRDVDDALAAHADLVDRIDDTGADIARATPCPDGPDRALVVVTYQSQAQRDAVDAILVNADGFGVPVELVGD